MGRHKNGNGLVGMIRYSAQQQYINEIAESIGCVAFRPNYHGDERDGNTVLIYTREDNEHNLQVEEQPTYYNGEEEARMYGCTDERYYLRPYFWSFANTDVNGRITLDFANFGRLDLRGLYWKRVIYDAIMRAYDNKTKTERDKT